MALRAVSPPTDATMSLNAWRSSPARIASMFAPIRRMPYRSRTPESCNATAAFSAVWPPIVASSASGRSRSMIFVIMSGVIGST